MANGKINLETLKTKKEFQQIITKYIKSVAKEDIYLLNTSETISDYQIIDIKILKGEKYDCRVQVYPDGRHYFTAFKIIENIVYCSTRMKRGKEVFLNCGGIMASKEIAKELSLTK